ESTRLPVEQLGESLGASRRTLYNWLAGRPIGDEAQSRIFRFRDAISPVLSSRDPALVRAWLVRGQPAPAMLAAEERWEELDAVVRQETSPIRAVDQTHELREGQPYADSQKVLTAALAAFAAAPNRTQDQRSGWSPREVTG